jgi:hypothetical protein
MHLGGALCVSGRKRRKQRRKKGAKRRRKEEKKEEEEGLLYALQSVCVCVCVRVLLLVNCFVGAICKIDVNIKVKIDLKQLETLLGLTERKKRIGQSS